MISTTTLLSGFLVLAFACSAALAGTNPESSGKGLAAGDAAPAFELPGSDGKTYALEEFAGGRAVVVAWFPKAFTGG